MSLEFGKHGIEGVSNGGEIWGSGNTNQTPSRETELNEYYSKIGKLMTRLAVIAERFYNSANYLDANSLAQTIVEYNVGLAEYRSLSKNFFERFLQCEWNSLTDENYIQLENVNKDMRAFRDKLMTNEADKGMSM